MILKVQEIIPFIFLLNVILLSAGDDMSSMPPMSPGLVMVRGGTFLMGEVRTVGDEEPVHPVTVNDFYIGKYEVTQDEWLAVMGTDPSLYTGKAKRPVESVNWYEAVDYCNKRSQKEGLAPCYKHTGDTFTCDFGADGYRLPTEAEWEYAARGGMTAHNYHYSGSNDIDEVAWYEENLGDITQEVGLKKPNELGIYDMSGNAWEWCWDWYDPGYYQKSPADNPKGPDTGQNRIYRGGGSGSHRFWPRITGRYSFLPNQKHWFVGFRTVRSAVHKPLKGVNNDLILVQGGTFPMGGANGTSGEKPARPITLRSFYIGQYEITQEEWRAVMNNNPSLALGAKNPVNSVNWYDAVAYCNKRSLNEGLTPCYSSSGRSGSGSGADITCDFGANGYRLPTEAEWEYACRGGAATGNYKYSGSDNAGEVAWYAGNSGGTVQPVGQKKPNELGIYDMSGNVYEWCWDLYDFYYYEKGAGNEPKGPVSPASPRRVLRGGGIAFPESNLWSTFRFHDEPSRQYSLIGFRVVRTAVQAENELGRK